MYIIHRVRKKILFLLFDYMVLSCLQAVVTLIESVPVGEEIIQMALKTGLLKNEPTFKRLTVHDLLWGTCALSSHPRIFSYSN